MSDTTAPGTSRARFFLVALAALAAAVALAWLGHEAMRYLEPAELDRKPFPLRGVDLQPATSRDGLEFYGRMKLRIYIDRDGTVDHVDVVSASLPAQAIESAVKAFREVRWEPGTKSGLKRRSVNVVEINFEPPVRGLDRGLSQPDR